MAKFRSLMIAFVLVLGVLSSSMTFAAAKQASDQGDAARLKPAYRFERS